MKFFKALMTAVPRVTPAECAARVRAGDALLVDVREAGEWTRGVAEHAVLLPMSDFHGARARWKPFLAAVAGRELLLYCGVGVRAAIVAKQLAVEGFAVKNAGGLKEWKAAGWPMVVPAEE